MADHERLNRTQVARRLGLTPREVERAERAALAKILPALRADRQVRAWADDLGIDTDDREDRR